MAIVKNKLKEKYTQVPNAVVVDTTIKAQAFRMFVYIWSKPDGWEVWNGDIAKSLGIKDPKTIANCWKQLEESGWISRVKSKSGGFDYELHEEPNHQKTPIGKKPLYPKNPHHSNTDLNSNTIETESKIKHGVTPTANPTPEYVPNYMKGSGQKEKKPKSADDVTLELESEIELFGMDDIIQEAGTNHTQKMLFQVWQKMIVAECPELGMTPTLSVIDKTQLKLIAKKVGMAGLYEKLGSTIGDWYNFTQHCESAHNAYKSPEYPNIQYLQKYCVGLNTFGLEEEFKTPASKNKTSSGKVSDPEDWFE